MRIFSFLLKKHIAFSVLPGCRLAGLLVILLICYLETTGQTGTSGNPFTQLGHAWHVPSDGIYYFDIGGTAFSTYVEAGSGWVLAISGSASTTESIYPTTTSLTLQSDEILPATVYTSVSVTTVRINATSGGNLPFDVQTSDATVLDNLRNDRTLSVNSNGSGWTGAGATHMSKLGSCSSEASLAERIYHGCNNQTGLHWLVADASNLEKVVFNSGRNDLNLWIRASAVALPVELSDFSATSLPGRVHLSWQTSSETNNAGFDVQRSADGKNWDDLAFVSGQGSTLEAQSYTFNDKRPLPGLNYYRLRQVDFDGESRFSRTVTVETKPDNDVLRLFPNPSPGNVTLTLNTDFTGEASFKLYGARGELILSKTLLLQGEAFSTGIDLPGIRPGLYLAEVIAGRQNGIAVSGLIKAAM